MLLEKFKGISGKLFALGHYHAAAILSDQRIRLPNPLPGGRGLFAITLLGIVFLTGILGHLSGQHSVQRSIAAQRQSQEMDVLVLAKYTPGSPLKTGQMTTLKDSGKPQTVAVPGDYGPVTNEQPIQRSGSSSAERPGIDHRDPGEAAEWLWLSQKLAAAKADIARLCALGHKLVALAEMDDGEFDFSCQQGIDDPASDPDKAMLPEPDSLTTPSDGGFDELSEEIALLFPGIDHIDRQLQPVEAIFTQRRAENRAWPSGLPVFGATGRSISSPYGYRQRNGKRRFHKGLDLAAAPGSAVLAMASGVVAFAGTNGDYGNLIEIDHGNGYTTRYGHNRQNLVAVGAMVRRGQMIARVGSTGKSTGPHLHVEIRKDGASLDPLRFIALP